VGSTRATKAQPIALRELIAKLRELDRLTGEEKVKAARALISPGTGPLVVTVQAVADAEVVRLLAQAQLSAAELAKRLGYASRSGVTDAVLRHKDRLAGGR
jgi:AraC-like DNA-binding protein